MLFTRKSERTEEEDAYQVIFESSLIKYATGLVLIALILWITAISTDYWIIIIGGYEGGIPLNGSLEGQTFLWSHSGLWKRCDYYNPPQWNSCSSISYLDHQFVQVELVVIVIVFLLVILSTGFSFYSIKYLRYTYKRITGSLHLLTAAVLIALFELIKTESHLINHHEISIHDNPILSLSRRFYGYSFLIAYTVFIFFIITGLVFFYSSKKREDFNFDRPCVIK